MSELLVKDKDIVVPGEVLAVGMDHLPGKGTYREDEKILAGQLGLVSIDGRAIKLIPMSGRYIPKTGDTIVCKVTDILMTGWRLDTNSAYSAVLSMKDATSDYIQRGADLTQYFNLGEWLVCKIVNVTSQKLVDVTMKGPGLRNLKGGRVFSVNTNKVPRIIGKQGSMVSMLKNATGCRITVGQNGWVWIDGEADKEVIVVEAIRKIEEESHTSGLTDKMKEYLEKVTGQKVTE
ncbi:MAG: exosome complex protein Rrp4 [Nanoarchaeota archaeon]|nr:exosome complex protein Rrp4 [Nanoarchaeota archaeon]MBU1704493.1 exosome complex protein Rrp4 [Nanoarchaeota archaeon]